jgi:serine O-acetyltransferase
MFPDYFRITEDKGKDHESRADELFLMLKRQITSAYAFFDEDTVIDTERVAYPVMEALPEIKRMLMKDVIAIYEGDPAARSPEEIILSYPGFYAISIYRIAHQLYKQGIPYMPRLMTEFAHEKTGIDIHAGATIGEYFFIDHGTGIVIGETTTIGNRVKIYQGVTLGAKSFELDENGNPVKGIKRHPDIGDDCVIYANATILGGNTKIGKGVTIGGNVWLTHSVPDGEVVYYNAKK